jgi:hypothetical protein
MNMLRVFLGYLRQYRRRLDHVMDSDDTKCKSMLLLCCGTLEGDRFTYIFVLCDTFCFAFLRLAWELMYTHRVSGVITHTSLSKHVFSGATTGSDEESQDEPQQQPPMFNSPPPSSPRGREVIRLAIVYRVVQEEHVSYHMRVYHFGVFQHHAELRGNATYDSLITIFIRLTHKLRMSAY